jgi:hypothetical protein
MAVVGGAEQALAGFAGGRSGALYSAGATKSTPGPAGSPAALCGCFGWRLVLPNILTKKSLSNNKLRRSYAIRKG